MFLYTFWNEKAVLNIWKYGLRQAIIEQLAKIPEENPAQLT